MFARLFTILVLILLTPVLVLSQGADPAAYCKRGNTLYAQGEYDQAIIYYKHAIELQADYWQAYAGLSYSYYMQDDNARALASVRRASELNPSSSKLAELKAKLEDAAGTGGTEASGAPSPGRVTGVVEKAPSGDYFLQTSVGFRFIREERFERMFGQLSLKGVDPGIRVIDETVNTNRRAICFNLAGNYRVKPTMYIGLEISYSKLTLAEFSGEYEYTSWPFSAVVSGSLGFSGTLLAVCPTVSVLMPMNTPIVMLKGGIGLARSGLDMSASLKDPDIDYRASVTSGSTGIAVVLGADFMLPMGETFFATAELGMLIVMKSGACTGTMTYAGSAPMMYLSADEMGGEEEVVLMEAGMGLSGLMFVPVRYAAEAEQEIGARETAPNFGGTDIKLGFGAQF